MAVDERAAALNEATKNLTRVTTELQKFNESTGVEIAKIVGKDLKKISDPFVSSFMAIPGVQTLSSIGGTLFNKAFAKMKEKREMKHLQDQLGLDKMEFERFRKQNDVLKAEEKAAAELKSASESILGFSIKLPENFKNTLGVFDKTARGFVLETEKLKELKSEEAKLAKDIAKFEVKDESDQQILDQMKSQQESVKALIDQGSKPTGTDVLLDQQLAHLKDTNTSLVQLNKIGLDSSNVGKTAAEVLGGIENSAAEQVALAQGGLKSGAAAAEAENNRERREGRRDTLFGNIANGIEDMKDGIINGLAGLKDKGLLGLGILAGLVAAPFIAISAFFTQLMAEVKVLNALTKGGLGRFFSPFTRFFNGIKDIFSKGGTGQFLKGDTIKMFGKFGDDMSQLVGKIKSFFKPITDIIGKFTGFIKSSTSAMQGFSQVTKFAATIGRVLGKLFLPITILMGVFDGVTGFIRGFKEDGLIGGIKEAVIGVVDGLVGGLIRMVTGALSFILDLIGLDKFAASLTENVNSAIEGVYDIFRGVIDVITFPFRLIFEMVKGIFGGETDFGGLFGGLGESIMGIFGGLIDIITAPFDMIYGLVQDIFSFVGFELPDFDIGETIKGFIEAAKNFVKDKVTGFFSFLGFGGDDKEEEVEKAVQEEQRLARAGAVSEGGELASTVRTNGFLNVEQSEANVRARGFEVATPEQRAALEEAATLRREQAEQALEDFRNAPKLSDAIGAVKEKMSAVFSGISTSVSEGFSAATNFATENFPKVAESLSAGVSSATAFAKGLFTFSDEDASVAGIATKLIDIVLAPYNLAINFLKGIFGFGEDEQGNVAPFSLGEMIVGVVTDIIDFFKGLFDIDIMGLVKSIPGAGKILDFFGFGGDEPEVATPQTSQSDALLAAEMERDDLQKAVDKGSYFSVGRSDKDEIARINELNEEIAKLKMAERTVNNTVVNNNNVVNAQRTSNASTTTIAPMRDTSPPAGSIPAYG